ncbi:UDP-glucosyltransferase, putative [Ricinus communis]|uniref:UDP-glucosyltransferase, putative n=1 Tax=Ricinus communis TaxID=3988 RepID=B9S0I0_RICCO|nr:UDP-glucosyltransferase, putative [Ricinus communis]
MLLPSFRTCQALYSSCNKACIQRLTITFINTESIHHQITKAAHDNQDEAHQLPRTMNTTEHDIFFEARQSGLDICYATVSDGFPLGFDGSLNHDQFMEGLLHVFSAHVDDIVGKIVQTNPTVNCLIADTFYVWSSMIAQKYNLVNISFWTGPALIYTLYYHLDLLNINGHFASGDKREDALDYIYLEWKELESKTISGLQQKQPFYPIGPLFPTGFTKITVATSLWSESDCTQWLEHKPHGSVLYVSFGSYAHCSKEEIVEIAHGLLLSEMSFIWVLRPDIVSSDDTDFLPDAFESEIKDKGLIVPWIQPKPITRTEVAEKINRLMHGKTADD